jgi:hypothetical protein
VLKIFEAAASSVSVGAGPAATKMPWKLPSPESPFSSRARSSAIS